jgi:glycosyltransferase involved in cell wall biosynthesis
MKQVLIIEAQIKQYRVPFYDGLRATLQKDAVELSVAYSDPPGSEAGKKDTCELASGYSVKVKGHWLLGGRMLFQPLLRAALTADLVIVDQANKFVLNHLLLPLSRTGLKKVAFVGHGRNGGNECVWLSEWYRRVTLNWATWWFAYTASTTRYLLANGVPASKITTVSNATDTSGIRNEIARIPSERKLQLRATLEIASSAPIGLYCGAMDKVKKIPFLIAAARMIREHVPDFHLLLVGGGPEEDTISESIRGMQWIHALGPRFGRDKAELIAISDVCLIPGAVGLVILDAFAGGLPLLSTFQDTHGPEIEYLENGTNGLLCEPDVTAFAMMTVGLLSDREALSRFRLAAAEAGARYTIDNMIDNFHKGICECLAGPNACATP